MNTKPQYFQIQFKAVETKGKATKIEGYASTPDPDRYDDIVEPKAFMEALDLYMKNPVVLLQHNMDKPIGTVEKASIDEKGLRVTALIEDEETCEKIEAGILRTFSIGFMPLEVAFRHKETGMEISLDSYNSLYWEDMKKYFRVIKKVDLAEISVVSVPANGHALFNVQKSLKLYFDGLTKKEDRVFPANEVQEEVEEVEEKEETQETTEVVDDKTEVEEKPEEATQEEAPIETQTPTGSENAGESPAPSAETKVESTPGEVAPVGTEKALTLDPKDVSPELKAANEKLEKANTALVLLTSALGAKNKEIDALKLKLSKTPNLKGLIYSSHQTSEKKEGEPEKKQYPAGSLLTGMLAEQTR